MRIKITLKPLVVVSIFIGLLYAASIIFDIRFVNTVEKTHSGVIINDSSDVEIYEMALMKSNVPYEIETLKNGSKQITWDIKYSDQVKKIKIEEQFARPAGPGLDPIELEKSGQYPFNN